MAVKDTANYTIQRVTLPKTSCYKVKRGDNLTAVANEYDVSISEIKKWNNLKSNMLTYGKSLKIISNQSVVRSVKKESDTDRVSSQAISKNQNVVAYKSKINTISAPLSTDYSTLYVVQEGDSLFSIAKKHPGVTISDLKKWNGIRSEDIKPGMKLKING